MSGYGGGGGGRGRVRGGRGGRTNRGGGGGGFGGGGGRGGGRGDGGHGHGEKPRLMPCSNFTSSGQCQHGDGCRFSHAVKMHSTIDASTVDPDLQAKASRQDRYHQRNHNVGPYGDKYNPPPPNVNHPVSSVSVWSTPDSIIKIFSGGHDGHWRLWNASQNFVKEFDHSMGGGKIETIEVASNYLFCGFEGTSRAVPGMRVGMIHAWNLQNPADPPLEFHVGHLLPYAHNSCVSAFASTADGRIVSGGHDGTIRTWKFDAAAGGGKGGFSLVKTMAGHAGEVTGLVVAAGGILWSGGVDGTVRLWDLASGELKYLISQDTPAAPGAGGQLPPPQPSPPPQATGQNQQQQQQQQQPSGVGHTAAITELLLFESPHGNYILTSSLDTTVKAWDASNGTCLHSESHGEAVTSMALSADLKGNPLLLVGLTSGAIMVRSVLQTPNVPAFCLMLKLSSKFLQCGHTGPVRCLRTGPGNTFYSAGGDGRVCVWQITGDLGL